jgi:hypothetical protein
MPETPERIRAEQIARKAIDLLPNSDGPFEPAQLEEVVTAAAQLLDVLEKPAEGPTHISLVAAALLLVKYRVTVWGTPPEAPTGVWARPEGTASPPTMWVERHHKWSERGYYKRYRSWLKLNRSEGKLNALDAVTNDIIGHLGNPAWANTEWNRRGVVVGQVQSGKTETYIGVVAKAIDAGYKSIVVLAGLHNDLRAQTQLRIDEGIVGTTMLDNEQFQRVKIGVGEMPEHQRGVEQEIISMTSGRNDGDFNRHVAQRYASANITHVYIVKKNVLTLQKIVDHFRLNSDTTSLPILVIDDECDQASVNVGPDENPTATNREIRNLLNLFPRNSFVGFTATPMANIFINPEAANDDQGNDLYPKDFIIRLKPSAEYLGPERLFGIDSDPVEGTSDTLAELVVGTVDWEDWLRPLHRRKGDANKSAVPAPLPESLLQALADFVVGAAVKRLRLGTPGKTDYDPDVGPHATMLVHVTSRVDVQKKIREQIDEERERIVADLIGGSKRPDSWGQRIEHAFHRLNGARAPLFEAFSPDQAKWAVGREFEYREVLGKVREMIRELEVNEVNGTVEDGLRYRMSPNRFLVAVGGNKLSRGLTLEGLTVSYFLRSAGTWDTMMQMGRWFGYRPRYLDLCRVYMPKDLILTYENVTRAIADLNRQFDALAANGDSPREFGLRLQKIPTGHLPTRRGAMRNAQVLIEASHSATLLEKLLVPTGGSALDRVRDALDRLWRDCTIRSEIVTLGNEHAPSHIKGFREVGIEAIIDFITTAGLPVGRLEEPADALCEYLKAQAAERRMVDWTVGFVGLRENPDHRPSIQIGDLHLVPAVRATHPKGSGVLPHRRIKNLSSLSDESLDLSDIEYDKALRRAADDSRPLKRTDLRSARPFSRGLLLCYPIVDENPGTDSAVAYTWAISFPEIPGEVRTEYYVNRVDILRNLGVEDESEGDHD